MDIEGYRIEPLTPDRFDDFEAVLGTSGQRGCWCMYWIAPTSAAWEAGAKGGSTATNKDAFHALVEAGPPPGLLAYDDDEPVAWCRVTPRTILPGLANSRHFKTDLDVDDVWSLSCFVVRASHRRRGLSRILTEAAISYARDSGARRLEVYPTDTAETMSTSTIYTGVASTFRRLGFAEVQRLAPHKPMMRLDLI